MCVLCVRGDVCCVLCVLCVWGDVYCVLCSVVCFVICYMRELLPVTVI